MDWILRYIKTTFNFFYIVAGNVLIEVADVLIHFMYDNRPNYFPNGDFCNVAADVDLLAAVLPRIRRNRSPCFRYRWIDRDRSLISDGVNS